MGRFWVCFLICTIEIIIGLQPPTSCGCEADLRWFPALMTWGVIMTNPKEQARGWERGDRAARSKLGWPARPGDIMQRTGLSFLGPLEWSGVGTLRWVCRASNLLGGQESGRGLLFNLNALYFRCWIYSVFVDLIGYLNLCQEKGCQPISLIWSWDCNPSFRSQALEWCGEVERPESWLAVQVFWVLFARYQFLFA